jgi:hypothetical protein
VLHGSWHLLHSLMVLGASMNAWEGGSHLSACSCLTECLFGRFVTVIKGYGGWWLYMGSTSCGCWSRLLQYNRRATLTGRAMG